MSDSDALMQMQTKSFRVNATDLAAAVALSIEEAGDFLFDTPREIIDDLPDALEYPHEATKGTFGYDIVVARISYANPESLSEFDVDYMVIEVSAPDHPFDHPDIQDRSPEYAALSDAARLDATTAHAAGKRLGARL